MARRQYTPQERAQSLAALAANGGNVKQTSIALGIPRKTLEAWSKGQRHPEAVGMAEEVKGDLADKLEEVAYRLLAGMPDKLDKANLQQTAIAVGIAIDKAQLLRNRPTAINDERHSTPTARIAEFERRYAALHGLDVEEEGVRSKIANIDEAIANAVAREFPADQEQAQLPAP